MTSHTRLNPSQKEDIIEWLKEEMTIQVDSGGFTDPNSREISIFIGDQKITSVYFDVVQKPEYEG